jgi:uncharacterized protein (TIGR03435 family)
MRRLNPVWLLGAIAGGLVAQSAGPAFEVASIKPSPPDTVGMQMSFDQGRLSIRGGTVQFCVAAAWRLQEFEIGWAPKWFATDRFDIVAKAPDGAGQMQLMQMLQNLLADRFALQFHREEKLVPGYALVVAKAGPKLKESAEGAHTGTGMGRGVVNGTAAPMARLAEALARVLGRPVADETGLTGKYDFRLTWTPADSEPLMQKPGATPEPAEAPADSGASVFTAIQEQLGLRLEARRAPVQVMVIDRLNKPTAN